MTFAGTARATVSQLKMQILTIRAMDPPLNIYI